MGLDHWYRHSRHITRTAQWKVLRLQAKRRDGWKCIKCGGVGKLEVDHIQPVRTHPLLAYVLSNLQTLCSACHAAKTRIEVGFPEISPARAAWRDLLKSTPKI